MTASSADPGECFTCGEGDGSPDECPTSERTCGHHCNHSWTHDVCHWCGTTYDDQED